jgi:hypothetical protein
VFLAIHASHARIAHKVGRFILAAYPALAYAGASAWLRGFPWVGVGARFIHRIAERTII